MYIYIYINVYIHLSPSLSLYHSLPFYPSLSMYLSLSLSVALFISLSVFLPSSLSLSVSMYLSLSLYFFLCTTLSLLLLATVSPLLTPHFSLPACHSLLPPHSSLFAGSIKPHFPTPLICNSSRRNPATCSTHQGDSKRRFDPSAGARAAARETGRDVARTRLPPCSRELHTYAAGTGEPYLICLGAPIRITMS